MNPETEQPINPPTMPKQDERNFGQMWSSNRALIAQHVAGMSINYSDDTTSVNEWNEFTIRNTANGDIVVTLENDEFTFTNEHTDCDWCSDGKNFYSEERDTDDKFLRSRILNAFTSQTFSELGTREFYFATFVPEFGEADNPALRGYVLVGNPTTDFSDLNTATAT